MSVIDESSHVRLSLFFCKDISSMDTGQRLLSVFPKAFPGIIWDFRADDRDEPVIDDDLMETDDGAALPFPEHTDERTFLDLEWRKPCHGGLHLVGFEDAARNVRVSFRIPPIGGTALWHAKNGQPMFTAGECEMSLSKHVFSDATGEMAIAALSELAVLLEASFGYIKLSTEGWPWRLDKYLPGVFWVTLFGTEYVEWIGRHRFTALPAHAVRTLQDGSVIVVLTSTFAESLTWRAFAWRLEVMRRLGLGWFFPRPLNKKWYPRIRNLVTERERP